MKRTKNMIYQPTIESRELELYAENHAHLYMLSIDPLLHSLAKNTTPAPMSRTVRQMPITA